MDEPISTTSQDRPRSAPVVDLTRVDGVVFDVDGVVTDTARVHAASWKRAFDEFLRQWREQGPATRPFDPVDDYLRFVDGRPRLDGVRGFLGSRGITLRDGSPDDPDDAATVNAVARRKNGYFLDHLRHDGVAAYPSTVALLRELRARGAVTAAVSASGNAPEVLSSAGVLDLFDARVDGRDLARLKLPGKPDPAMFLEGARRLRTPPARLAAVEDSLAGVEACRRGEFALVVGVDRGAHARELLCHGADVAVADLGELSVVGRTA